MRIVDRATFLAMPAGTLYQKFKPMYGGELAIKEETLSWDGAGRDWYEVSLNLPIASNDSEDWANKMEAAHTQGASLKLDVETMCRDGYFDDDQLFAVWERDDVEALVTRLQKALETSK